MKLVSGKEMRGIDRSAQEDYGISELVLMENAGNEVARSVMRWLKQHALNRVLIAAGSGNNGGDALVAARHLLNAGVTVRVLLMKGVESLNPACRTQFQTLEAMGCVYQTVETPADWSVVYAWLEESDLLVDGIYGTGFHGTLPENAARLAVLAQQKKRPVLAIDIPSGVEADTGRVNGEAFRADITVTLALPKPGLYLSPGAEYAGRVQIKAIGMPYPLLVDEKLKWHLSTRQEIQALLPKRKPEAHKGSYGHVTVIGGSGGMIGAVRMASRAALKTGAGCVTAVIPSSMQTAFQTAEMEVMTRAFQETPRQQLAAGAADEITAFLQADKRKNVYVLGPGLGRYEEAPLLVKTLLQNSRRPVVVDAAGLVALAGQTEILKEVRCPLIFTPHPGEMAALTGLSVAEIEENRTETALQYARDWNVILVLKGHRTLIAAPDGRLWLNTTGNDGMATAGSGDVLSGLTAGLIAQGVKPLIAAVTAVYLHGAAGDYMVQKTGRYGLVAGDLIEGIPAVMRELSEERAGTEG